MYVVDYTRELWSSISRNRVRTAVASGGVAWGAFLLVAMLGFSTALDTGVRGNLINSAANSVFLWGERTTLAHAGWGAGRPIELTRDDADAVLAGVPGVGRVAPRYETEALVGYRDRAERLTVMGDVPGIARIELLELVTGRFVDELDLRDARKVVVLGRDAAAALAGGGDVRRLIGEYVAIDGARYRVVGVCRSRSTGPAAAEVGSTVFIPLSAFERSFQPGPAIDWLALTAAPGADAAEVERAAVALLQRRHGVHPDDELAFGRFNAAHHYAMIAGVMAAVRAVVWIVGVLTLLSSAVGIGNIMLIAVAQRRREIGVRRALGATSGAITRLVVLESATVVVCAGALGVMAAGAVIRLARDLIVHGGLGAHMLGEPRVSLVGVGAMAAVLVIAGAVAGWLPARRATRLPPVTALADL